MYFTLSTEEFAYLVTNGQVIDATRGGLVIGRSHDEGHIHMFVRTKNGYENKCNMQGGEYIINNEAYWMYKDRILFLPTFATTYKIQIMKRILFLFLVLFISVGAFAQDKLEFSQVIKADSLKRDDLYIALKEWVVTNYNSPKDVIQMDDKDAGLLICNGVIDYSPKKITHLSYKGIIKYSLKIQVKDNRYKVDISNFIHQVDPDCPTDCQLGLITNAEIFTDKGSRKKYQNAVWDDIKIKAQEFFNTIFQTLQESTENIKAQDSNNDDW